uniref:Uncharacterized protein n=1 Tax=Lactuca sativa TaxID=4236 RepID=A0A9R1WK00_LACSA|nr:hypothetical protein LSAT_V11C200096420 [Lactuca sativa]
MQDELEAELEELEGVELEEQLLQPSTTAPAELLTILATTIANIEPHQIHTYYESGRNHITRMERTIPLFHQLHYTRHHLNTLTVEILYSLAGKPS